MVQIALVRGRSKPETDKKDVVHQFFEEFPGFWVALESMVSSDNHAAVELGLVPGRIPGNVGIINTNVGGDGRAASIGIRIDGISEEHVVIVDGSDGEE